mmetsp:Transcript_148095/g.258366  ORF Transcript_148095/g.258366 Transcript_148095/m.258366 type:complete len:117 (-) Transcript_148095:1242-1592(-)
MPLQLLSQKGLQSYRQTSVNNSFGTEARQQLWNILSGISKQINYQNIEEPLSHLRMEITIQSMAGQDSVHGWRSDALLLEWLCTRLADMSASTARVARQARAAEKWAPPEPDCTPS